MVYMAVLLVWSSYQIYQLRNIFATAVRLTERMADAKRKNYILALGNLLFGLYIIVDVSYIISESRKYPWKYLSLNILMSTIQHVILIVYVFVVEKYLTKYRCCTGYFHKRKVKPNPTITTVQINSTRMNTTPSDGSFVTLKDY